MQFQLARTKNHVNTSFPWLKTNEKFILFSNNKTGAT
ncbi:hypothetical protein SPX_40460 [Sporomusa paucivorans]